MKRLRFYAYEQHSAEQAVLKLVDPSEVSAECGYVQSRGDKALGAPFCKRSWIGRGRVAIDVVEMKVGI